MYCTRCGTSADDKQFCTRCGFELKKSVNQAAYVVSSSSDKTFKEIHQTIVIDQNAAVEQSSEMSNPKVTRTTRNGSVLALLTISLILLLSVAAGFGPWRYFKNDRNRQMSIAPVVIRNDQAAAPAPELKTDQPTNPTPDAPGEKTATNIETKPSVLRGKQPAEKNAAETPKRIATTRKAAPQNVVIPNREVIPNRAVTPNREVIPNRAVTPNGAVTPNRAVTPNGAVIPNRAVTPNRAVIPNREANGINRDRQMIYDDYERYRRYLYNYYGPDYRDRYYMRRRYRWNYR